MDDWKYQPAETLDQTYPQRLRNFPREPEMVTYACRWAATGLMRAWLRLYHRLEIRGREHLPASGAFIMVANHSSHLDAVTLLAALPMRRVHHAFPCAAQDYFFSTLRRTAFSAIVLNALPFNRKRFARHSLEICGRLLDAPGENVLVLFPEGTRSRDGVLGQFKPGVGLLAAGRAAPVIPCWIQGAHAAWPPGALFPRPRRIRLTIGTAMQFADRAQDRSAIDAITRELRAAVAKLAPRE